MTFVDDYRVVTRALKLHAYESTLSDLGTFLLTLSSAGFAARHVRGRKMRTFTGVFDEFSAVFQFPPYFGENVAAFEECLQDLDAWVPPGHGYVLVVSDAVNVLADEGSDDSLRLLIDILTSTHEYWSRPIEEGEWWDRPAIPFHVVLHSLPGATEATAQRWRTAGAAITREPGA